MKKKEAKEEDNYEVDMKFQNQVLHKLEKIKSDADSYYKEEYILKFREKEKDFKEVKGY